MAKRSVPPHHQVKERMLEVECPYCANHFFLKVHTFQVAGLSAKVDGLVEDGAYFRHQCQKCGNVFPVNMPFVYKMNGQRAIVVLSQMEKVPDLAGGTDEKVYICRSGDSLAETVRAIKANVDIDEVRTVKAKIESKRQGKVWFLDCQGGYLWFETKDGPVAVKRREME